MHYKNEMHNGSCSYYIKKNKKGKQRDREYNLLTLSSTAWLTTDDFIGCDGDHCDRIWVGDGVVCTMPVDDVVAVVK